MARSSIGVLTIDGSHGIVAALGLTKPPDGRPPYSAADLVGVDTEYADKILDKLGRTLGSVSLTAS